MPHGPDHSSPEQAYVAVNSIGRRSWAVSKDCFRAPTTDMWSASGMVFGALDCPSHGRQLSPAELATPAAVKLHCCSHRTTPPDLATRRWSHSFAMESACVHAAPTRSDSNCASSKEEVSGAGSWPLACHSATPLAVANRTRAPRRCCLTSRPCCAATGPRTVAEWPGVANMQPAAARVRKDSWAW